MISYLLNGSKLVFDFNSSELLDLDYSELRTFVRDSVRRGYSQYLYEQQAFEWQGDERQAYNHNEVPTQTSETYDLIEMLVERLSEWSIPLFM